MWSDMPAGFDIETMLVKTREGFLDQDRSIADDYIRDLDEALATRRGPEPWGLMAGKPNGDVFLFDLGYGTIDVVVARLLAKNCRTVLGVVIPSQAEGTSDGEVEVVVKLNPQFQKDLRQFRRMNERRDAVGDTTMKALFLMADALEDQHPEPHAWAEGDWFQFEGIETKFQIGRQHPATPDYYPAIGYDESSATAGVWYFEDFVHHASPCSPPQWFIDQEQSSE